MDVRSLSIIICTHNRAPLLARTLEALARARVPPGCAVEAIVVDNNCTDETPAIVRRAAARCPFPVRYDVERRQGKSYALNRAMSIATGDILALTDDDVLPAGDWLTRIVENFRARELVFLFGKVLPRWESPPPPELITLRGRDIWGPLALIDYGDEPVDYDAASFGRRRLPIGANLALRRDVVAQVGGWRTDLGKVDNTLIAGEDRELCVRLYRAGLYAGFYDPSVCVRHYVPAARMTRAYFRRWFYWHGRTMARMASEYFTDLDFSRVAYVGSVPRFMYRQFFEQVGRWLQAAGRSDALSVLIEELRLIEYLGFFSEARRGGAREPARRFGSAA